MGSFSLSSPIITTSRILFPDHALSLLSFVVLTALLVVFLHYVVIYPVYLSPLARIPNAHWSSPLSALWILRARRNGHENAVLLAAHRKLGSVVRVGPNDVSIDDIDYVKTVYGGGFDKTDWYGVFNNYGVPCMFSTQTGREHALRKRMLSHVYSKSFIQSSLAVAHQTRTILLERLLPLLTASAAPEQAPAGIDVFSLFLATSMDFVAAHVFGLRSGTDFLRRAAYRNHWLQLYLSRHGSPFFPQELPRLTRWLRRLRLAPVPRWVDWANEELAAWNEGLYKKAATCLSEARLAAGNGAARSFATDPGDEPTVMQALVSGLGREEDTNGAASILYDTAIQHPTQTVLSELFDHVLAGHETTGIALTYLTWQLSRHPDAQRAVQQELRHLASGHAVPGDTGLGRLDAKPVDALPILHAVVVETLRLHAPIPGPQPRQTPASGCRIGPYAVPGGVRIAALAHTLHRNTRVFPDPERWDHTRWLDRDGADHGEEGRRSRARQFWAFSSGGRMCIGSNFAMHEMKMVAAIIYSRFTTYIVDDSGMEQTDG
ncbi:Cytochrome P450 [Niveomyces insectorum RCEF 264]|uniref:Cytochrome P450 n=1 Tax=Niveomyces insectorum RCEF 264 TaxID=1081102 RepID=A0A167ZYT3_9HYPO|nr:Cytochrome P450 [Niveomyces insectorum RCEF 264]